ncbi:MAG: nucleotidyltransferase substrate binding protein [bacterium]|nr:nucleotidyltransferase substrate binding protein [bacterium]MDE0667616.1 nucleotidyltransferase substrate binding protein [bacterium]
MSVDLTALRTVLQNLEEQHDNLLQQQPDVPRLDREGIMESVIQRFEICYDMAWKVVRRYLHVELRLPDIPNSPRPVLRLAAENHLLGDGGQRWQDYSSTRIQTTHMYSQDIVDSAMALMPTFIRDTADLIKRMEPSTQDD